jgi:ATP-dependent Clp protease protease subunit
MFDWLKIRNKDNIGELCFYGEITDEKWCDEDTTPKEIRDKIGALSKMEKINMYVNSPGGGVFAGLAIYNMLNKLDIPITAHIEGVAASIMSVIIMAADERVIPENAFIMIHNPMGVAYGDANEMRKEADLLDRAKESIMNVYKTKVNLSDEKIAKLMDNETWMLGEEAVEYGFANKIDESNKVKACFDGKNVVINGQTLDLNTYKTFPSNQVYKHNLKVNEQRLNKLKRRF